MFIHRVLLPGRRPELWPSRLTSMRLCRLAPAVVLLLVVVACSDSSGPKSKNQVAVTAELDTLLIGESQPLAVTVRDAGGNVIETGEITWTVDKPSVASVVGDVLVAKSAGTVKVTANIGQSTGSATLVILPLSAATVTVAPATATLGVGQVLQLTAALSDIRGMPLTGRAISWSSSAPSVATVNASTGLATMVSAGDVTF